MLLEAFHFLRPWWLLALLPLAFLCWRLVVAARTDQAWQKVVEARLLARLLAARETGGRRGALARAAVPLLAASGLAATLALAGPAWERLPQRSCQAPSPLVLALGVTPGMSQTDLAPDRLARARFKLRDLLAQRAGEVRDGGRTGLVIYAGEPFVVAPLTDDIKVIDAQVPVLRHDVMPAIAGRGETDRPDRAIAEANALLRQAGEGPGRILLLADDAGSQPAAARQAAADARAAGHSVSVLAVLPPGDAVPPALAAIAQAGGGSLVRITADDADIRELLAWAGASETVSPMTDRHADAWADQGYWLLLLPLLLAPLAFRRGLVAVLVPAGLGIGLLLAPADAARAATLAASPTTTLEGMTWADLWASRDRQGEAAFAAGDPAGAAALFQDPLWRAAALHRAGEHAQSATLLEGMADAQSAYNRGNALAHAGRVEAAIDAYDQALELDPAHADAIHNRAVLQALLDRRAEEEAGPEEGQEQSGQEPSGQDQAGQDQSGQEQTGQAQAGQDQAGQDQSGQDQSGQDQAGQDQAGQERSGQDAADPSASQQAESGQPGSGADEEASGERDTEAASPQMGEQHADTGAEEGSAASPEADLPADRNQEAMAEQARALREEIDRAETALQDGTEGAANDPAQPMPPSGTRVIAEGERSERDQAAEQWLARVQDDPGALLRERLRRKYLEDRYGENRHGRR